ncbi:hypothetical protein AMAG_20475 [Allomyces macrogynus ATCC 38327]|uniref:Telomerase reverse transcriptase n=1 Tax=Allomyces macrogynus (strain ATCC 38327) TaxID=578462 RepID=A0A0L0TAZ9_ALLM3|nr:hypothetical protein AMAG_20475 [Allomyces macrogynus ATCC 38327]|eukprot:KNE71895.1 hypothetical protein AMAG_20475 [Allomyces macrogynus ATCC 38327]
MKRHLAHWFVEIVPPNACVTYHRCSLVPKTNGTRLILNQSKAIVIGRRGRRPWVSGPRNWERRQIPKVVGHCISAANKAPLGAGLHKLADAHLHARVVELMKRVKEQPESNLSAFNVDIESAFDSIVPAKLVGHVPKLHRQLRNEDLAPPLRDASAIYVDNVQYPSVARDKVVQTVTSIAADSVIRGLSGKYYQQLSGIPQDGVLSPLLCQDIGRSIWDVAQGGEASD